MARQTAESPSLKHDLTHAACGLAMGGADIIPGVSGGTMALILGVYGRLVTAISRCDLALLTHLKSGRWAQAAEHIDLRFLVALGCGIVTGVVGLAGVMHHLLTEHPLGTWSFLFGMILASAVLVALMVPRWTLGCYLAVAAGAGFALWLVSQLPAVPPDGYWYIFLCGMVAICAMILPGISGAFILVIMGMYFHVTGILKGFAQGQVNQETVLTVGIFVAGCGIGLISFSKFLRVLLTRHESLTLASMCGILVGSLRKIWPFKHELSLAEAEQLGFSTVEFAKVKKYRLGNDYLPDQLTGDVALALGLAVAGLALVLILDRLTHGHRRAENPAPKAL